MAAKISVEKVTPKLAKQWLNANKINRKLREGVAEKYAADMANGAWTECLDPIAFYETGDIASGQHRLWAIVVSETTQTFIIARDVPLSAGLNIDTGLARSLIDNARISGKDTDLSLTLISTALACEYGERQATGTGVAARRSPSLSEKLVLVNKHREAATWAVQHGPKGRYLRNALVLGALARAWYNEPNKDRLAQFAKVLGTGFAESMQDSGAVALRNYLTTKGSVASSAPLWRDTFWKVQNAIWYFMRGRTLTIFRGVKEERYPLLVPSGRQSAPAIRKQREKKDARRSSEAQQ